MKVVLALYVLSMAFIVMVGQIDWTSPGTYIGLALAHLQWLAVVMIARKSSVTE